MYRRWDRWDADAAAAEVDARAEAEDIAAQAKAAATARASHLQQSVDKLQFLAQAATSRAEVAALRARDRRRPQLRGLSEEVIAEALARYSQSAGELRQVADATNGAASNALALQHHRTAALAAVAAKDSSRAVVELSSAVDVATRLRALCLGSSYATTCGAWSGHGVGTAAPELPVAEGDIHFN